MRSISLKFAVAVVGIAALAPAMSRAWSADYSHYVSPWKTPWDYEGPRGPDHWGALDPAYAICNSGKEQSPIDIRDTEKTHLPRLRFEYVSEPVAYVINNGHTIRVNYHDAAGTGSSVNLGETRYQLTQFHFHRPAEEHIQGKQYDMVLHLMHAASNGEVLGVTVFLTKGRANRTVQQVWEHMPRQEGQTAVTGLSLNPRDMLPNNTSGHFIYTGSVTAPPCTEGVKWLILKSPVEVSAGQIEAFAKLYPNDVRPIQPLNGRVVMESE